MGACQVIRKIKITVLLPGSFKVWRQPVLRFWFKTILSTFGVSLGFEGRVCLVTVLLCAETKDHSSLVLKVCARFLINFMWHSTEGCSAAMIHLC